ncbi:MAG: GreA/GreB family elongation factor [Victivallaceae bacterium]|nr:GreA/GreB family elongation factor [Victivallaceae bacterium]
MKSSIRPNPQDVSIYNPQFYNKNINKAGAEINDNIIMSREDFDIIAPKLQSMIFWDIKNDNLNNFADVLEEAIQVPRSELPAESITLGSKIELMNTNSKQIMTKKLVMPPVNYELQELSVFTPVGMAVFGKKIGDIVSCKVPTGIKSLKIKSKIDSEVKSGFI